MTSSRNRPRKVSPPPDEPLDLPPMDDEAEDEHAPAEGPSGVGEDFGATLVDDEESSSRDDADDQSESPAWMQELIAESAAEGLVASADDESCGLAGAEPGDESQPTLALDGDERGLLEESDESRDRGITFAEAGIVDDDADEGEDEGHEGVVDPSFGLPLEREDGTRGTQSEEEGAADEVFLDTLVTPSKAPPAHWPAKSALTWELCTLRAPPCEGDRSLSRQTRDLQVEVVSGRLVITRAARRELVPDLFLVSCAGIWENASGALHVLAAIHEPMRDIGALVLVRVADDAAPSSTTYLEFDAQDLARTDPTLEGEPDLARIEQLSVRVTGDQRSIIVGGAFGIRQIRLSYPLA